MPDASYVVGLWLWSHYADASTLVAKLRRAGATGVILKYHEGASAKDNTGYDYQATFRAVGGPLKAAGFGVAAWGYNYPGRAEEEAALIAQAFADGADWYCFDAEGEFDGQRAAATALVQATRQKLPQAVLGYAPFPFADLHPGYPYAEFDAACQLCLPQIYAGLIGRKVAGALDVDGDYNHTYLSLYGGAPLRLTSRLVPCFSVSDGETAAQIGRMAALSQNGGFRATAWWVLDDALDAALDALAASPYARPKGGDAPTPPTATPVDWQAEAQALAAKLAAVRAIVQ